MERLILYFFSEEAYIDYPKTFQSLKEIIIKNFFITENNFKNIKLCYNNSDSTLLTINNENDYKSFLKKKINNIYLDVGQNYEIYEEFLAQIEKKDSNEDFKRLNELMKKDKEYKMLYETKFKNEENRLIEINKLIEYLNMLKTDIVKQINQNKKLLENDHQKILEEISELKVKMGIK